MHEWVRLLRAKTVNNITNDVQNNEITGSRFIQDLALLIKFQIIHCSFHYHCRHHQSLLVTYMAGSATKAREFLSLLPFMGKI